MTNTELRARARHAANAVLALQPGPGTLLQLSSLYEACQADCPDSQNGVRWAVLDAKRAGLISKTDKRGLYAYTA